MREDGVLVPCARIDAVSFSDPWSEANREPSRSNPPKAPIPVTWYVSTDLKNATLEVRGLKIDLVKAQCNEVWGMPTDVGAGSLEKIFSEKRRIALAFDRSAIKLVPEEAAWKKVRASLGLVSNGKDGEGYHFSEPLGYFWRFGRLFGVELDEGWESQEYEVFEISDHLGKILTETYGGSC